MSGIFRRKSTNVCNACKKFCSDSTLLKCADCDRCFHRECLKLDRNILKTAQTYDWRCNDCKCCERCRGKGSENNLILCDSCDRGFHIHCLKPPLSSIPKDDWKCPQCKNSNAKEGQQNSESIKDEAKNWSFRRKSNSADTVRRRRSPCFPPASSLNESQDAKKRRRKNYAEFYNVSSSLQHDASVSPNSKFKNGSNEYCPVEGCSGEGHLSRKYSRHSFYEACPIYHNIAFDQPIIFKQVASKSEDDHYNLRTPSKDQRQLLKSYETERETFDKALLKKLSKNANDLTDTLSFSDRSKEPDLQKFSLSHDLDLFRKAQCALAEELVNMMRAEHHPDMRSRKAKQIKYVEFDGYEMETFYLSPYPDDVAHYERLYVCQTCLKYMKSQTQLESHMEKCTLSHPPGKEIYRKGRTCVYEVDGSSCKIFCQNLCLLAKLFLDHKTLYYDVEPFLFYVLTEDGDDGCHIVGYFSKEKESVMNCNLSCLLVLPSHQRRGYGRFLIELSYLLSKAEDKIGSPEHPLSDMGLIAYRGYWKEKILDDLTTGEDIKGFSVKDLSQRTGIHVNDIISTLQYYGLVKYWRGEYWVLRNQEMFEKHRKASRKKITNKRVDPACLNWPPVKQEIKSS